MSSLMDIATYATQVDGELAQLRAERNALARLLGDAISARNRARALGTTGTEFNCREALVARLLARTAEVDTRLLRARIASEQSREPLASSEELALARALGLL